MLDARGLRSPGFGYLGFQDWGHHVRSWGKGKGMRQLKGAQWEYVVADGIEFGYGNTVPSWAFGLLY